MPVDWLEARIFQVPSAATVTAEPTVEVPRRSVTVAPGRPVPLNSVFVPMVSPVATEVISTGVIAHSTTTAPAFLAAPYLSLS
ncbi:hypothetical protein [Kitasatospora sp. MMS16-BH015]|uniref:hypothetical protein n=1 Tax=Kitasatospora sp. MMS16-BH015 TaxID=2018025 RepID=UPI0020C40B83|nr:hypothetical protein [Kitasatospora sp. MMS16-BH015]